MNTDPVFSRIGSYRNHVQIDAAGQDTAVIVIGMVAADFGASRSGKQIQVIVSAESGDKSGYGFCIPFSLAAP